MSGLDKIVAHIMEEGRVRAEEILKSAQNEADKIISDGKIKTFDECERIAKKADEQAKSIGERAVASAELKKKQILLSGKQELIKETIDKAMASLNKMSDEEYTELIGRIYEGHVPSSNAVIMFNSRDMNRIPRNVLEGFVKMAADKGAVLTVSEKGADIQDGFVLDFGGIEENCSFSAIIEQNMEELQDRINRKLFG